MITHCPREPHPCSGWIRRAGPPSKIYGDSALLVAIRSQKSDLLGILLKHVPDGWPTQLQNITSRGMAEGKLYALACILRRKGLLQYPEWCLMTGAKVDKEWGAHYLLGLEQHETGYFMEHWDRIGSIVLHAEQLQTFE